MEYVPSFLIYVYPLADVGEGGLFLLISPGRSSSLMVRRLV